MNHTLENTIQIITGKNNLDNITQKELQVLINDYPYFAPVQLLYAAKLKKDKSYQLQTQMQKAGLFFTNARWLQYQITDLDTKKFVSNIKIAEEKIATNITQEKIEIVSADDKSKNFINNLNIPSINDVKNILSGIDSEPKSEAVIVEENIISTKKQLAGTNIFMDSNESILQIEKRILEQKAEKFFDEKQNEIEDTKLTNEIVETFENEQTESNKEVENINSTTELDNVVNFKVQDNFVENNYIEQIDIAESNEDVLVNEIILESNTVDTKKELTITEQPSEIKNDIHAEIAALKANWQRVHSDSFLNDYNNNKIEEISIPKVLESILPEQPTVTKSVEEAQDIKIENTLTNFKKEWNKPVESFADIKLAFETEPYYTIDYFASQGIKFDYTQNPNDKLTSKMLKFTDWLKKLKNVKYEPEIKEDPELDKVIQNIAAKSNQSKEVVTETMAEIFANQGKTEQAIQLYIKLSFLIPSKSTYFAIRIKELKGI